MILESTDVYAEQWSKQEQVDLKYLSEFKDQIQELVVKVSQFAKGRLHHQNRKFLMTMT